MSDRGYPTASEIHDALTRQHDERLRHALDGQVPDWLAQYARDGRTVYHLDPWQLDLGNAYREVLRRRALPAPVPVPDYRDAYQPDFEEAE